MSLLVSVVDASRSIPVIETAKGNCHPNGDIVSARFRHGEMIWNMAMDGFALSSVRRTRSI